MRKCIATLGHNSDKLRITGFFLGKSVATLTQTFSFLIFHRFTMMLKSGLNRNEGINQPFQKRRSQS